MAKWTEAIEDYVKHIYYAADAAREAGDVSHPDRVAGQTLARRMGVSHASVTNMLKRLSELELVEYEAYRGVRLTDAGTKIALEVIRHHRLIESYLAEVLGMPWDEVHEEAEILEHHISERVEALMAEKLGHPRFDPHGHPIPALDGVVPTRDEAMRALTAVEVGASATVRAVRNERAELLRFLDEIGVVPDRTLTVQSRAPLGDTLTIVNDAGDVHAIGREIAECIHVS